MIFAATWVSADTEGIPKWTDFYGDATTYNDRPIPVGSIIEAFDIDGIKCGETIVSHAGSYGFLGVIGDDTDTQEDEGPLDGEAVSFKINGRDAATLGPDDAIYIAAEGSKAKVNLSATALVSMTAVSLPTDHYSGPGETIRYIVIFQNTGEGTDFYSIEGISAGSWMLEPQSELVYVESMGTGSIYIDVIIPPLAPDGTTDLLTFTVRSHVDPTVELSGDVTTHIETTSIGDDDDPFLPNSFVIHQNYPNPFNPSTVISYELPTSSQVTLEVFNLLGQSIDKFDLGVQRAGLNTFTYNAENIPSGVYFYSVTAGDNIATRKMVLMK